MGLFEELGINDRIENAVRLIVESGRSELRRLVAVPVEWGEFRLIRSRPGEPPRRETGVYQASITADVELDNDFVVGSVFSCDERAPILERGGYSVVIDESFFGEKKDYRQVFIAPRPHWVILQEEWDQRLFPLFDSLMGEAPF